MRFVTLLVLLCVLLTACGEAPPTATPVPPPPTNTALPPTNTAIPPTNTAIPPTSTAVPPTNTLVPPTATEVTELPIDQIADKLRPATLLIKATLPETPLSGEGLAGGTGFLYDLDNGYILTNNHVVEGAASVQVFPANSSKGRAARIVGRAQCDDLAVLKVDNTTDLGLAKLGDSKTLKPGVDVVALGYPESFTLGGDLTVSKGIVSKLHHQYGAYQDLIQTDAAINHGNSGGPLVNRKGEVIGVNSLAWYSSGGERTPGINFAISMEYAQPILKDLQAGKNRDYIGLNLVANQSDYQQYFGTDDGLIVAGVATGSPGSQLGIEPADLLLAVEGKRITYQDGTERQAQVCDILRSHADGDRIKLTVLRPTSGEVLQGELTMGKTGADTISKLAVIQTVATGANGNNSGSNSGSNTDSSGDVNIVLDTKFASGEAGPWDVGETDGIKAEVADGLYTISLSQVDTSYVSIPSGMDAFTDGVAVAQVTAEGTGWAGVVARYSKSGDTSSMYFCGIDATTYFYCAKKVKGTWTDTVAAVSNDAIKAGVANTIAIAIEGTKIAFQVNGTTVGSFTDAALTSGQWGVLVSTAESSEAFAGHFEEIALGQPK